MMKLMSVRMLMMMLIAVLTALCVQEEDHDDPLCLDQRTIGHLDGPQVHWDHVKGFSRDKTVKASETI